MANITVTPSVTEVTILINEVGVQGATGPQGLQGIQGVAGTAGTDGTIGADGIQGIQGVTGSQGIQGETGLTGLTGSQGVIGATGTQGVVGPAGIQGIQGDIGVTGIQGIEGAVGPQGLGLVILGSVPTFADLPAGGNTTGDVYEVDTPYSFYVWDGANWDDIGQIQGPQGIQGIEGADSTVQGPQGIQGIQGIQGDDGVQGIQGIQGEAGVSGATTASELPIVDTGLLITAIEVEGALAENRTAINLNTSKVSDINHNVTTDLSFTRTPTTLTVASSDGTDAILPEANTTNAGLLGSDKWDAIGLNTDKISYTDSAAVALNTAKVGYTEALVSANTDVAANTAKTGITAQQASDITTNNDKVTDLVHPLVETAVPIGALFTDTDTVYNDTVIQGEVDLNTAKISYTDATKVGFISVTQAVNLDTIESDTATNNAKVGITPTQASNIVTNNAKLSATGNELEATDIDTLAELNVIITDATLIDTADSRLSDARTPLAHNQLASTITDFDTEVANNTAVALNTAKVTDLAHPLVETAVPLGAVFTDSDTVYDDTAIQAEVTLNTAKVSNVVSLGDGLVAQDITDIGNLSGVNTGDQVLPTDFDPAGTINYVHPTTDGSKHVPANSTTNDGKVLTATAIAGTYTWEAIAAGASYLAPTIISSNTTAVSLNVYVFTADLTLTLPITPTVGDKIKVSNMSGVLTCVIARNGSNIAGLAEDLTVDTLNIGFELIYSGATKGWVLT